MCELKVCKICLRTQCKLYKDDQFQLKLCYDELMASHMTEKQKIPQYFCYECAMLLHKFRKFKEKCYSTQNTLNDLQRRSGISYKAVEDIRSLTKCIKSSIDIMTETKRVKTFYVEYNLNDDFSSPSNKSETDSIKEEQDNQPITPQIEYVICNTISEHNQEFEEKYDSVDKFEPETTEEVSSHEEESQESDDIIMNNLVNENTDETNSNAVENLPPSPKKMFLGIKKEGLMKKNISTEKYPKLKSSERPSKTKVKLNQPSKKKDVDFEPDNFSIYGLKERNPVYAKKKKKFLGPKHWKKSTLTEEEVLADLKKKAEEPKYLASKYKCVDCVKWFREERILKRHRKFNHDETIGKIVCRFCHMRFKLECYLRRHLRSHFTKYECLRCDLVCSLESTALYHEDYHNGVIKKCKLCDKEFKHSSTYYTHLRTHRSEYLCPLCGMSFVSPLGLLMHKKVKHAVNQNQETREAAEETDTFCTKCNIRFESKKAYEEHIFQSALHAEGIEFGEENTFKKKQVNTSNRRRQGSFCNKQGKPTTCHQCGKHFKFQSDCMKHHLAEHKGVPFLTASDKLVCEICGRLVLPCNMPVHLNSHTNEQLYSCATCDRQFNNKVSLKRHQVTHTGEKKFPCPLCEKRFTQSNSMKLHYRTYHLKEPYPKRNRRKKEIQPVPEDLEGSSSSDSS